MSRLGERLIDLAVLFALLWFARDMRADSPEIAGVIVAGAVQFWMTKNAAAPHTPDPAVLAAVQAAAEKAAVAAEAAAALVSATAAAAAVVKTEALREDQPLPGPE